MFASGRLVFKECTFTAIILPPSYIPHQHIISPNDTSMRLKTPSLSTSPSCHNLHCFTHKPDLPGTFPPSSSPSVPTVMPAVAFGARSLRPG